MSTIPSIQIPDIAATSGLAKLPRVVWGRGDLWGRIAHALNTDVSEINLEDCRLNPSGNVLRCKGRAEDKSFYAKVYLSSNHPVPPRFTPPWTDRYRENGMLRTVSEQIKKEWEMTQLLRTLLGFDHVPAPRGMSCKAKTIVWDLAGGKRLDSIAKRAWLTDRTGKVVGTALFNAGKWLRKLHNSTNSGQQIIDLRVAIRSLETKLPGKRIDEQLYVETAIEVLRRFITRIGTDRFPFPLVLSHGDFCLANLIWETRDRRLTVVDFELTEVRPAVCDLFALVSDLRSLLLLPLIPKATIHFWETSFWDGYEEGRPEVQTLVCALAVARIYYHMLPRILTRRLRRGRLAGLTSRAYRAFVEPWVVTHRLDISC